MSGWGINIEDARVFMALWQASEEQQPGLEAAGNQGQDSPPTRNL